MIRLFSTGEKDVVVLMCKVTVGLSMCGGWYEWAVYLICYPMDITESACLRYNLRGEATDEKIIKIAGTDTGGMSTKTGSAMECGEASVMLKASMGVSNSDGVPVKAREGAYVSVE